MADVYRARDLVLDRDVAVKILREATADDTDRARFVTEARVLAGLSHTSLVMVLDAGFGSDEGSGSPPAGPPVPRSQPFVVMELVEGPTLAQVIADGPLPPEQVASVGVPIADALAYVHAGGVVHRDVKPGNVLLGSDHRVKLADFGIARLLGDTARHTLTGTTIGTAAYLAPEQVTGREVTGATDVYSLGLVLLEALTGRREYPGTATEAAFARLHRSPHVPDELPGRWRDLLAAMTSTDPADRPPADLVAERLRSDPVAVSLRGTGPDVSATGARTQVLTQIGVMTATARPEAPAPRWPTRLIALAAGAVVGVLALVAIILAVTHTGDDGTGGGSQIPDNTPANLRQPLHRLHLSIEGSGG